MKRSWEDLYGEVPASFETRMRDTLASLPAAEPVDIRRFRFRPSALIAAVLMVMLLTGAAFATDLFGLKSLIVTDPYAQISPTASPAASDLIALQGFPESPEFKANSE